MFPALAVAAILGVGIVGTALAQGAGPSGPSAPARSTGNPAADTRSPGATATEAITDPARVPAAAGPPRSGVSSATHGESGGPTTSPSTGR